MSDIKNEDDIIIQTIKRKSRTKENKFASLSKEMTTHPVSLLSVDTVRSTNGLSCSSTGRSSNKKSW